MERLLVGPADVHARPAPHRFEPLEDLDVAGGIAGLAGTRGAASATRLAARSARAPWRRPGQVGEEVSGGRAGLGAVSDGLGHARSRVREDESRGKYATMNVEH